MRVTRDEWRVTTDLSGEPDGTLVAIELNTAREATWWTERFAFTGQRFAEALVQPVSQKYFLTIHSGCHWSGVRFLPVRSIFSKGLLVAGTSSASPDLACQSFIKARSRGTWSAWEGESTRLFRSSGSA